MGGGLSVMTSLSSEDLPQTDPALCTHKFCEKWGPGQFHCCDCHSTIEGDQIAEEERVIDSIVDNSVPEDGVHRGVTIQFLVDFANSCNCWDMTTRDVRRRFIMPATRASRCRFVELPEMATIVGKAVTFVSHTWGAKFGDLVAALCDGNADRSRVVWVDIFAVRQWPSHKPDLDFSAVVRQCRSFVIVCSSLPEIENMDQKLALSRSIHSIPPHVRAQVAFLRVWCLVELHAAILSNVAVVMKAGSFVSGDTEVRVFKSNQDMLSVMVFLIDIESAEATVAADKERILGEMNATESGVAAVNEAVRGFIVGAAVACEQPLIQCAACEDKRALAEVLASPSKFIVSAAGCGYVDLLQRLIENGADLNARFENATSLMAAAIGGHMRCVSFLLQCEGCDVAASYSGMNAVTLAAMGGHLDVLRILINHRTEFKNEDAVSGLPATLVAAGGDHVNCVELLISRGFTIEAKNSEGATALMYAAQGGHVSCVEALLRAGCDVTVSDRYGDTALIYAEKGGHTACVELLRDAALVRAAERVN